MAKRKHGGSKRVVVAVRISEVARDQFRAVAGANGRDLSDVLREVIERAAARRAA
jgi:hypothetical protein